MEKAEKETITAWIPRQHPYPLDRLEEILGFWWEKGLSLTDSAVVAKLKGSYCLPHHYSSSDGDPPRYG